MRLQRYGLWMLAVGSIALGACAARGVGGTVIPDEDASTTDDTPVTPTDTNVMPTDTPVMVTDTPVMPTDTPMTNPCGAGQMMCGSVCVDVSISPVNCGSCGNRCPTGQSCSGGVCTGGSGTCAPPRTMCSTCTDINTDSANCGLCGFRCPTGESCTMGVCRPGSSGCTAPRMMCGTVCSDVQNDSANCGFCSNRCPTGQTCSAGRCTTTSGSTSPAGNPCTIGGTECGTLLECQAVGRSNFCTATCTDGTATSERSQCGGNGSTCLTQGEGTTARSFCTHACDPTASPGSSLGCRSGLVCTGWWYTHSMGPDTAGCFPFCGSSADCASPTPTCNTRTGSCGTTGADSTRLADGSACNPMITTMVPGEMTPRNTQCRGICFGISSTDRTQGLCGSFINLALSTSCPDTPTTVQPRAPSGQDNLGLCIFKACTRNAECGTGLICIYPEMSGTPVTTSDRLCQYATAAQRTGVP